MTFFLLSCMKVWVIVFADFITQFSNALVSFFFLIFFIEGAKLETSLKFLFSNYTFIWEAQSYADQFTRKSNYC